MRWYRGRIFMMPLPHLGLWSVASDRRVTGVANYHPPHLAADLLPVVNVVARLLFAHYFTALFFENCDNRISIGARGVVLRAGDRSEHSRHAIKLLVHPALDSLSPLYLVRR